MLQGPIYPGNGPGTQGDIHTNTEIQHILNAAHIRLNPKEHSDYINLKIQSRIVLFTFRALFIQYHGFAAAVIVLVSKASN